MTRQPFQFQTFISLEPAVVEEVAPDPGTIPATVMSYSGSGDVTASVSTRASPPAASSRTSRTSRQATSPSSSAAARPPPSPAPSASRPRMPTTRERSGSSSTTTFRGTSTGPWAMPSPWTSPSCRPRWRSVRSSPPRSRVWSSGSSPRRSVGSRRRRTSRRASRKNPNNVVMAGAPRLGQRWTRHQRQWQRLGRPARDRPAAGQGEAAEHHSPWHGGAPRRPTSSGRRTTSTTCPRRTGTRSPCTSTST